MNKRIWPFVILMAASAQRGSHAIWTVFFPPINAGKGGDWHADTGIKWCDDSLLPVRRLKFVNRLYNWDSVDMAPCIWWLRATLRINEPDWLMERVDLQALRTHVIRSKHRFPSARTRQLLDSLKRSRKDSICSCIWQITPQSGCLRNGFTQMCGG